MYSGVKVFQEFDPSGRAGGELREDRLIVIQDQGVIQAAQQFGAFFQNGQVGSEVGVKDLIEPG